MGIKRKYLEALELNKKGFLDAMDNLFPFKSGNDNDSLEVSYLNKKEQIAWKWKEWQEYRDNDYSIEKINQRLIAIPEIVFDIDPELNETNEDFSIRIDKTIKDIKNYDFISVLGVFTTGSRGVHIHTLAPTFVFRDENRIVKIKKHLLEKFNADVQKCHLRCMIALENTPHWKTGKLKRLL